MNGRFRIQHFPDRKRLSNPKVGVSNLLFWPSFSENCMKMKTYSIKRGRVTLTLPLDPPMLPCTKYAYLSRKPANLVPNRFFLRSLLRITSACIAILLEDGYSLISHRANCIRSDTRSSKYLQYPYRDVTTSC